MRYVSGCYLEGKHLFQGLNLGIIYLDLRHSLLKNVPPWGKRQGPGINIWKRCPRGCWIWSHSAKNEHLFLLGKSTILLDCQGEEVWICDLSSLSEHTELSSSFHREPQSVSVFPQALRSIAILSQKLQGTAFSCHPNIHPLVRNNNGLTYCCTRELGCTILGCIN